MKGREKREIPEKTRRPFASSSTIPTYENPGVSPPGIEPSKPVMKENSSIADGLVCGMIHEYEVRHVVPVRFCTGYGSKLPQCSDIKVGWAGRLSTKVPDITALDSLLLRFVKEAAHTTLQRELRELCARITTAIAFVVADMLRGCDCPRSNGYPSSQQMGRTRDLSSHTHLRDIKMMLSRSTDTMIKVIATGAEVTRPRKMERGFVTEDYNVTSCTPISCILSDDNDGSLLRLVLATIGLSTNLLQAIDVTLPMLISEHLNYCTIHPSHRELCAVVVRILVPHQDEPAGSPPDFSISNRAGRCRWSVGFTGISCFPHPCIPLLLHTHLDSPSSALKTLLLKAVQTSRHSIRGLWMCLVCQIRQTDVASRCVPTVKRRKVQLAVWIPTMNPLVNSSFCWDNLRRSLRALFIVRASSTDDPEMIFLGVGSELQSSQPSQPVVQLHRNGTVCMADVDHTPPGVAKNISHQIGMFIQRNSSRAFVPAAHSRTRNYYERDKTQSMSMEYRHLARTLDVPHTGLQETTQRTASVTLLVSGLSLETQYTDRSTNTYHCDGDKLSREHSIQDVAIHDREDSCNESRHGRHEACSLQVVSQGPRTRLTLSATGPVHMTNTLLLPVWPLLAKCAAQRLAASQASLAAFPSPDIRNSAIAAAHMGNDEIIFSQGTLSKNKSGSTVVSLLASHQGEPGSIPAGSVPDFRKWESFQMMPLVSGPGIITTSNCRRPGIVTTSSRCRPSIVTTSSHRRLGIVTTSSCRRPGIVTTPSRHRPGIVTTSSCRRPGIVTTFSLCRPNTVGQQLAASPYFHRTASGIRQQAASDRKGGGHGRSLRKPTRTIPKSENQVTHSGIEPGSPRWKARSLTA
ncbi:hypothetical protein PR048_014806 [Dryococelus australis]|uniref:Uncharacterized protein n=1 Tax=Dryococelus australis TaxID=614101 RepID=A0ABQ9HFE9_9NEOP|nr:hypothetical protein PR048_014806 [Dryococelus australis]